MTPHSRKYAPKTSADICRHEYHEMDSACADGCCPVCLSGKFTAATSLLRIIARGVEVGQCGNMRKLYREDMITLARNYCDANGLSYSQKDLRVDEALARIEAEAR